MPTNKGALPSQNWTAMRRIDAGAADETMVQVGAEGRGIYS